MASRAVRVEGGLALLLEDRLGHDGARRVPRAEEQNVISLAYW